MDMMDGETEVRDYGLERLIMLSDGVFAIAMTLLALDLRPEAGWDHTLAGLPDAIGGSFVAFFWSFFAASIFWTSHRRQFGAYRRADAMVTFFNLVLLGEIILLPAATRILTEMHYSSGGMVLYLGLFLLIGCTNAASWIYVAFFTDILRPPRRGPAEKAATAFLHIVMPVGMTTLGVWSAWPGLHWLPMLMPMAILIARGVRWAAVKFDNRHAHAATVPA